METALRILENDGLLAAQGAGKRRRIVPSDGTRTGKSMRLAILLFEKPDRGTDYILDIENQVAKAGHEVIYATRTLTELGMDTERMARMVARTQADAWVVLAGSQEVLEWFTLRGIPVLAVFGRRRTQPIAGIGPGKIPAIREAAKVLLELGHRKIVFLTRKLHRLPEPSEVASAFFEELMAHGVSPSPYHLPDWVESVKGLDTKLESLYRVTPPTAMIIDEPAFFVAARHFLGRLGLAVPQDESLICTDGDPAFAWCTPPVSHIRWDHAVVSRRVAQWVSHVSKGKKDLRQTSAPAVFVRGGTIAPAKR